MKSAIFRDLAICPLLVDKTAIAATGRPRSLRFASLGNLFREARPATPQRQNDGSEREGSCRRSFGRHPENFFGKPDGPAPSARMTERARATARVCHGCRGSFGRRPESCFGTGKLPAPKLRKRARATRPSQAVRGSFNRRRENFLGKLDGPDPSVKTTGTSFRAARRARPKPKPSMILRVAKNGTRRARAGFLRTLNPKRF